MESKNDKKNSPFRIVFVSGLVAGAVFLVLEMILAALTSPDGMMAPPRMIASILRGNEPSLYKSSSSVAITVAALFVHFTLSFTYTGILFAAVQRVRSKTLIMLCGTLLGLLLYFINFYAFTEIFFWFESARNWMSLVGHLVFGFTAGLLISRMYTPEQEEENEPEKGREERETVKEREKELV